MVEYAAYMATAAAGYLSYLDLTERTIVEGIAINRTFEILFTIVRLAVYVKLSISIPTNFFPLKRAVYDSIYGEGATFGEPQYFFC